MKRPTLWDAMTTPSLADVGPLAGTDLWNAVLMRAGCLCQCDRMCPSHKGVPCDQQSPHVTLIAGPVNPGPDPARTIARVSQGDLRAWCIPCWDRAVSSAKRAVRDHMKAAKAIPGVGDTLF